MQTIGSSFCQQDISNVATPLFWVAHFKRQRPKFIIPSVCLFPSLRCQCWLLPQWPQTNRLMATWWKTLLVSSPQRFTVQVPSFSSASFPTLHYECLRSGNEGKEDALCTTQSIWRGKAWETGMCLVPRPNVEGGFGYEARWGLVSGTVSGNVRGSRLGGTLVV